MTGGSKEGMRGSRGAGRALGGSSSLGRGRTGPETARKAGKAQAAAAVAVAATGSKTKDLGVAAHPMIRAGESMAGPAVRRSLPEPVLMTLSLRAMVAAALVVVGIHLVVGLMTLAAHLQTFEAAEDLMISTGVKAEVEGAMEVAVSPMVTVAVTGGALHNREVVVAIVGAQALVKTGLGSLIALDSRTGQDSRTGLDNWTALDNWTGLVCRTLEMVAGQEGGGQKGVARMTVGQAVEDQMVAARVIAGAHVGKMGLLPAGIEIVTVTETEVVTGTGVDETETGIRTETGSETGTETEAAETGTRMSHASGAENPSGTILRRMEDPRLKVTQASTH